jgi:hypothetical protein
MKRSLMFGSLMLIAGVLSAQPPAGPGRHGDFGRGPGPGFGIMSAGPGSRTPVTGAPYSGVQTTEIQQTLADGNQISRHEQSKVYRDGQGRVRMEHTMGNSQETIVTIFDPVAGYSHVLNPAKMTAMKTPVHSADRAQFAQRPRGNRTQPENIGTQTINGVFATGTRITESIPAGAIGNSQSIQIVREIWVSNDLKVPVMIKSTDPRFGSTVMQLTNIVQAEPDVALFQVPSGYTTVAQPTGPRPTGMRRRPQ